MRTRLSILILLSLSFITLSCESESTLKTAADSAEQSKASAGEEFISEMRARFASPDMSTRPETRWWLAQGMHTDETLIKGVHELYDAGFRSVEILELQDPAVDASIYGWGSDQWRHDMKVILTEMAKLGMGVGFTSGCSWMPAVPGLDPDSEAALQELNYTWEVVKAGKPHPGLLSLPDLPDTVSRVDLVKVIAAKVVEGSNNIPDSTAEVNSSVSGMGGTAPVFGPGEGPGMGMPPGTIEPGTGGPGMGEPGTGEPGTGGPGMGGPGTGGVQKVDTTYLASGTLADMTGLVKQTAEGFSLDWTAPADGDWIVFAFWNHGTGSLGESSAEDSYMINHFSVEGPEAQMAYWDKHIFTDDITALFEDLNNIDFFQDSLEIHSGSGLYWCGDFLDEFEKRRGYDLSIYLPILIAGNASFGAQSAVSDALFNIEGEEDLTARIRNDFFQTLTDLYMDEYLTPIRRWLNGHGINLRAQVSYGQTLEVSFPATVVDIPETETLAMFSVLDGYRMHSGTVHLYGKNFFSSETGAVFGGSYSVSLQEYLELMHTQFAAGVNRTIFHGYASVSGPEGNTQWPGYDGGRKIGFVVSERWGERMPFWRDINKYTGYIARLQSVLQAGVQKMDIGIVNLRYTTENLDRWVNRSGHDMTEGYFWADLTMQKSGYTYEYFAPQVMENEDVFFFEGGVLNPDGPAYQAIIVYQDGIPVGSAKGLLRQAKKGLPIVLLPNAGTGSVSASDSEDELAAVFSELKGLENVRVADSEADVVSTLRMLGISPRAAYAGQTDLLSVLRSEGDTEFLYIYNRGEQDAVTGIHIRGNAVPYRLDPWTGDVNAVGVYSHKDDRTILPVEIVAKDTAVYILKRGSEASLHATGCDADQVIRTPDGIYVRALKSGSYTTTLSDGRVITSDMSVPEPIEPAEWTLTVESWEAGDKKGITETYNGVESTEVYYETIKTDLKPVTLDKLAPWKDIEGIGADVSGIGTYSTSFVIPEDWNADGAYLTLGRLYQSASVYLNGIDMGEINLNNAVVDISDGLQKGENTLSVIVTSTLANRLVADGRYSESYIADYGLIGPVAILPFVDGPI